MLCNIVLYVWLRQPRPSPLHRSRREASASAAFPGRVLPPEGDKRPMAGKEGLSGQEGGRTSVAELHFLALASKEEPPSLEGGKIRGMARNLPAPEAVAPCYLWQD